jgi:hypothetical protein
MDQHILHRAGELAADLDAVRRFDMAARHHGLDQASPCDPVDDDGRPQDRAHALPGAQRQ